MDENLRHMVERIMEKNLSGTLIYITKNSMSPSLNYGEDEIMAADWRWKEARWVHEFMKYSSFQDGFPSII